MQQNSHKSDHIQISVILLPDMNDCLLIIQDKVLMLKNNNIDKNLLDIILQINLNFNVQFEWNQINNQQSKIVTSIYYENIQISILVKFEDLINLRYILRRQVIFLGFQNQYFLMEAIKISSRSKICKCQDKTTGLICCAKIIKDNPKNELEILEILRQNPHPNILAAEELYYDKNYYVIISELCEGGNLHSYVKNLSNSTKVGEKKQILKHILEGVEHLHRLGIMHRNLNLENILLDTSKFSVKIIDFHYATMERFNLQIIGTPGYIAPEIYKSNSYDELCDIYSVGAIFHALLSRKHMFMMDQQLGECNKNNQIKKAQCIEKIDGANSLFDKMTVLRDKRLSASQCLEDPYFEEYEDEEESPGIKKFIEVMKNSQQVKFKG